MATDKQKLGDWGEKQIKKFGCFKCKHQNTLKQLPPNFKCADISGWQGYYFDGEIMKNLMTRIV